MKRHINEDEIEDNWFRFDQSKIEADWGKEGTDPEDEDLSDTQDGIDTL